VLLAPRYEAEPPRIGLDGNDSLKGRDSRIFQAQDRAIDNFTLKGICAGII